MNICFLVGVAFLAAAAAALQHGYRNHRGHRDPPFLHYDYHAFQLTQNSSQ